MTGDSAAFEAQIRAEWVDPNTADAWRRWHDKSVSFWQELTQALLVAARLEAGQHVLDVAGGAGDPGLSVARAVGPAGHVALTDLSAPVVEVAREHARRAGLENTTCTVADCHALPFADAAFDRVTCRLGVMYFWDLPGALEEIRRVLKPGGVAAFVAWGAWEENEYMSAALGPFRRRRPPPVPPPGAPHPYRFSAPGSLGAELRAAGFRAVREDKPVVRMVWPGPPAELWNRFYEVSAALRPYLETFSPAERAEAAAEAIAGFAGLYDGHAITAKAAIVVATAVR